MLTSNPAAIRIIDSEADLEKGLAYLAAREPRFGAIMSNTGRPALRRSPAGLSALLRIVTDQMISLRAAEAIWQRIERELHPLDPPAILRRRHATLMKLGLSGAKARTFRALARAVAEGALPIATLNDHPDDMAAAKLVAIPGIGAWTAEIYLLSCLGRSDIWPAGDLALQAAAAHAFGLNARPGMREMLRLAEPWRPWRAVAARLLWAHYRSLKGLPQAS
jgi:DNA-3-methyladenine glycosylase II